MVATNNVYDDIEHYTFQLYLLFSIYIKHAQTLLCYKMSWKL